MEGNDNDHNNLEIEAVTSDQAVAVVQKKPKIDDKAVDEKSESAAGSSGQIVVSKNKFRKGRKYSKLLEQRKGKRALEKAKRKELKQTREIVVHRKFRGNDEKLVATERLKLGLEVGPKVVIDCRYQDRMTLKEQKRFAQQIRRAYSSNRAAEKTLHLYLTSLEEDSPFFKICCQQNSGFEQYILDRSPKAFTELFKERQIVYLSPDSEVELEEFSPDRVYIIGGIVDETTTKNISKGFAKDHNISTAKIPIDKYFSRSVSGTFKKVLTINQVVDIILEWHRSKNWVQAIQAGLPQRTGFIPVEPTNSSTD